MTKPIMPYSNLLASIQSRYPAPSVYVPHEMSKDAYCVGGALSMFLGEPGDHFPFPTPTLLARVLQHENPMLPSDVALSFAENLTAANDKKWFETAWRIADIALEWRPPVP